MMARFSAGRLIAGAFTVVMLVFMLAPLFFVVVNSFNSASFSVFPPQGFSLRWYENVFAADDFLVALRNSLIYALLASLLALMLGLGAALSIVRGGWRRRELLQSGVLSPLMVPRIVTGVAIFIAAVTVGLYPSHASIILAHVVLLMPYVTSLLVAALAQVNLVEEEAARDLGAGPLRTFWLATMPQIRGSMLVAAVFAFIVSFDEFDISFFLARSENMTLPVRMFLFMQEQENPTMAAMSSMLIGIMVLIVVAAVFLSRRTDLVSIFARRKV